MKLPADAELDSVLDGEELDGAFFLFGDAGRLRDDGRERLIDAALAGSVRDFDLDRFRGGDAEPEDIASALSMPPMTGPRRVVAVEDAQKLTPTGRKVVLSALDDPPPGLTMVVSADIPERSKASFYKKLKEKTRSLEWTSPKEQEIPGWLMERAESEYGFRLTSRAAQAMATAVGEDLSLLEAELEKLASGAGGEEVDRERVQQLVPRVRAVDRWDWLDRVASRQYAGALEDLPRLLSGPSESAVGLLVGMIDQHVYLGVALEGGRSRVAGALGRAGKPYLKWKARIYASQARSWSRPELERALGQMRRADRQAKSGVGDRRVLEELLLSLRLLQREAG